MNFIKKALTFVADTLESIAFVGSIYVVVYLFLFFPSAVQGASMEPTLHTGDRIIVNRIAYKITNIERGDVVVVASPKNPDIDYVKRVIGLPGETILFSEGEVYINGQKLDEPYVNSKTNLWENGYAKEDIAITIPLNYIFVMGDNRARSSDSREFGPVPVSSIVGKTVIQYFPSFRLP